MSLPGYLEDVARVVARGLDAADWPAVGEAIAEGQALAAGLDHPSRPAWLRLGALYSVVATVKHDRIPAADELRRELSALRGSG